MIIIDTISKALTISLASPITTNQWCWSCSYTDQLQSCGLSTTQVTDITGHSNDGLSNNTIPVIMLNGALLEPMATVTDSYAVVGISICNVDTVTNTMFVQVKDGANYFTIFSAIMPPGFCATYTAAGWQINNGEGTVLVGNSGYSGYSGISGFSGYSGSPGSGSGFSGYSGISGQSTSGFSGDSGTSGYSGFSGFSGDSGTSGFSGAGAAGYINYLTTGISYTLQASDFTGNSYVLVDTGLAYLINLPSAGIVPRGIRCVIKDASGTAGSFAITINGLLDGSGTHLINSNFGVMTIMSDGSQFWIVGN